MKKSYILPILFFAFQFLTAQERLVSGIVRDTVGQIPGANVIIKNKHYGVQTDIDGKYSVKATANDTIIFSFVGYKDKKVRADKTEINVILHEGVRLRESMEPPYDRNYKNRNSVATAAVSASEIQKMDNARANFKKSIKYNAFTIYVPSVTGLDKAELEFQSKYKIVYLPYYSAEYAKKYNRLVFKYLNKKYNKAWQSEIRKDAVGLNDFLR